MISLHATVPQQAKPGWRSAAFCVTEDAIAESGIVACRPAQADWLRRSAL